jgi:hypothetical protein
MGLLVGCRRAGGEVGEGRRVEFSGLVVCVELELFAYEACLLVTFWVSRV